MSNIFQGKIEKKIKKKLIENLPNTLNIYSVTLYDIYLLNT